MLTLCLQVDWSENVLQKREQRGKMSITLRAAIRACYTYHDCEKKNCFALLSDTPVLGMYLLEFCRKLITFTGGIENLQVGYVTLRRYCCIRC